MAPDSSGSYHLIVTRLAAWTAALPPTAQDLVLAVALAAYNIGSLIPEAGQLRPQYLAFALAGFQALPLALRRRWPVGVLTAVGLARFLYDQLGIAFEPLPLGPALAYYTVMDRSSARVRWVVSGLLAAGIVRSQLLPGHTEPYDLFVVVLEFAVAGLAGTLHRAHVRQAAGLARRAEADRVQQVALAAAQERARIARELHDVVAHHVSLMAVQSQAAASLLPGRPDEAATAVEVIGQTAREALTELRRLLGVLRSPAERAEGQAVTTPSPSISELDDVLGQVRNAGIAVDLEVLGNPGKLAPGIDLTAYRIVQEALTNTVRHSGASQACVTIRYEPGFVTVSVTDAGRDPASAPDRKGGQAKAGFGLAGIAERVAACGGSLTVGPRHQGGFAVTARLPAA
jgi:signal transduction histidine kinase